MCALYSFIQKYFVSVSTFGSFHNEKSSDYFVLKFPCDHLQDCAKITLDGRVKACTIIGCNSEYFLGIQPFKLSVLYIAFLPLRLNDSLTQHLKYHICTLFKTRCLKLAILSNWDLIIHILLPE